MNRDCIITRMKNCASTLIAHGIGAHKLDLDRIAHFQGFDAAEFRHEFHRAETAASMRACEGSDK